MKPTHKLIDAQVNKGDKCLGLTTASPKINQGIITYFEPYRIGFGSSSVWPSYYIVIMCNTNLADRGKHSAAKAALSLLLVFNYIYFCSQNSNNYKLGWFRLPPPSLLPYVLHNCWNRQHLI